MSGETIIVGDTRRNGPNVGGVNGPIWIGAGFAYELVISASGYATNSSATGPKGALSSFSRATLSAPWSFAQRLELDQPVAGQTFGGPLALIPGYLLAFQSVPDFYGDLTVTRAHFFSQRRSDWAEMQQITPLDAKIGTEFGKSVDLAKNLAVIGSPGAAEPMPERFRCWSGIEINGR